MRYSYIWDLCFSEYAEVCPETRQRDLCMSITSSSSSIAALRQESDGIKVDDVSGR